MMILFVRIFGLAYLGVAAAGTAIALRDDLPANFANWHLAGTSITRDFLTGAGTALAAPLAPLIALAVLLFLCGRYDRVGRISLALIVVLAAGLLVGMVGEPITREIFDSPGEHVERTIIVIASLALPVPIAAAAEAAYQVIGPPEPSEART